MNESVIILDYSTCRVIIIHLSKEQIEELDNSDDSIGFISNLSDEYNFSLDNCEYMFYTGKLNIEEYGLTNLKV